MTVTVYTLESTRLENRGFSGVARGDQPISGRCGVNKDGVEWKCEYEVDLFHDSYADFCTRTPNRKYAFGSLSILTWIVKTLNLHCQHSLNVGVSQHLYYYVYVSNCK